MYLKRKIDMKWLEKTKRCYKNAISTLPNSTVYPFSRTIVSVGLMT